MCQRVVPSPSAALAAFLYASGNTYGDVSGSAAIGGGTEDECLCGNLNTSLDDDVNEVKRGVRYIVGYQAACIIPQADIKITQ